jgi:hypothetical protein
MHQTSLDGNCLAAAAMKATAPQIRVRDDTDTDKHYHTLADPQVGVVQKSQCRAHKFPDAHLLEHFQFTKAREGTKNLSNDGFFYI